MAFSREQWGARSNPFVTSSLLIVMFVSSDFLSSLFIGVIGYIRRGCLYTVLGENIICGAVGRMGDLLWFIEATR